MTPLCTCGSSEWFAVRPGVEPERRGAVDLFTRLANGHLDKNIDALMPWAYIPAAQTEIASIPGK